MLRREAPEGAMLARQVPDDPALLKSYFEKVASYEADRVKGAERKARAAFIYGTIGLLVGAAGVISTASLAPFKTVEAIVFRVNDATGAVERVYDVRGGQMAATDASTRYFLWQYVRLRQSFAFQEADASFDAVANMSAPIVQNQYQAEYRGSNPNSPQVLLGRDGTASVRWMSTSMLGPKLAQVRFVQFERKGDTALPPRRMIATIAFDYVPGQLYSSVLNVNPLGFVVTSYRADQESTQ